MEVTRNNPPLKTEPFSTQHYYCTTENRLWTSLLSKQLAQLLPLGRPGSTDRFSLTSTSIQDTRYEGTLLPCTFAAPLPPEAVLSPGSGLLWLPTCLEGVPSEERKSLVKFLSSLHCCEHPPLSAPFAWVAQELVASSRRNSVVTMESKGGEGWCSMRVALLSPPLWHSRS